MTKTSIQHEIETITKHTLCQLIDTTLKHHPDNPHTIAQLAQATNNYQQQIKQILDNPNQI